MYSLDEFAQGALLEKFNVAYNEVLENIMNLNTSYKAKRNLTIKLTFATNEDRDTSNVAIEVTNKLAPSKSVETVLLIGKEKGKAVANEWGKGIPGQVNLEEYEEGKNNKVIGIMEGK